MRPTKYRNVPTVVDGIRFSSKKEANRDADLHLLQRARKISGLTRQPRFDLCVNGVKICRYVADWGYVEHTTDGKSVHVVEDAKGVQTPSFKIKFALAKALWPKTRMASDMKTAQFRRTAPSLILQGAKKCGASLLWLQVCGHNAFRAVKLLGK